ncbi:MAG: tyrosine-type recombinase/integrase [Myxococcota bacterium]
MERTTQKFVDLKAPTPQAIRLDEDNPSAGAFLGLVRRELRIRKYRQRTVSGYLRVVRKLLNHARVPPREITREHVVNFMESWVDEDKSSSALSSALAAIRLSFDALSGRSVTEALVTPRRRKRAPVVLSSNEMKRLLWAATSVRDKTLIAMLYASGLRVGEVVRLRWRDIDQDRGTVRVVDGKGHKDRYAPLARALRPLLGRWRAYSREQDYVFESREAGRYMSRRTAQRIVSAAATVAGLEKEVTCHTLRHTFATHAMENGANLAAVQDMLGHARVETTRIYTHVALLRSEGAPSPLDRLVEGSPGPARTPGRMRTSLHMETSGGGSGVVEIVEADGAACRLEGIVVSEPRPGWVMMSLPPREAWESEIAKLSEKGRMKVESVEFYERIRSLLGRRFLAQRNGRGSG